VLGEHPRAYLSWNANENEALTQLHRQGVSVAEIAGFLGRNDGAINSQLRKLGLEDREN
jgi:IS30 family transposase